MRFGIISALVLCSSAFGESVLKNQNGQSLTPNAWTDAGSLSGGLLGYGPGWVGFNSAYFSPVRHKVCWWEIHLNPGGTEANDLLECYSYSRNRQSLEDISGNWHNENLPFAGHSFYTNDYWDSLGSWFTYWPGAGSSGPEIVPQTNWIWDDIARVGRNINTNGPKNAGGGEVIAIDQARDTAVYFETQTGKVFHWTVTSGLWVDQQATLVGGPFNNSDAMRAYDSGVNGGLIYLFGGQNGVTCLNTVTTYNSATTTLASLSTTGTPPPARWQGGMAFDSRRNLLLISGGVSCDGTTLYNDTWTLDTSKSPAVWAQQSPTATYTNTGGNSLAWNSLVYDREHDVFVYLIGIGSPNGKVYLYSIDTSTNAGTASDTYAYPSGSQNVNQGTVGSGDSWAYLSSMGINGSNLFLADSETGSVTSGIIEQPRSRFWNGTSFSAGATVDSSNGNKSDITRLANVGGTEWMLFGRGGSTNPRLYTSTWNGLAWSTGTVVPMVNANAILSEIGDIQSCGGFATVVTLELIRPGGGDHGTDTYEVHVQQWTGSAWMTIGGTGALNHTPLTIATLVSMACTSNSNIWVTWGEMLTTFVGGTTNTFVYNPPTQIYVTAWNGSAWVAKGGSLNNNAANWASDPFITFVGTTAYVTWTERTVAGSASGGTPALPPMLMYVSSWNGSAWIAAGTQPVNRNINTANCYIDQSPCAWVWHPELTSDGTNLYASWIEQQAPGLAPTIQASTFNGTSWTPYGGTPSVDTVDGSPTHATMALYSGQPAIASTDTFSGLLRQLYVKQWNGTDWAALGSAAPPSGSGAGLSGAASLTGGAVLK